MCGILFTHGFGAAEFERGLSTMKPRGPDAQGALTLCEQTFMGHRRLKITGQDDRANHQPMRTENGRQMIAFNGEIYNYLALKNKMGLTPQWRSDGDTEVLLRLYAQRGAACLDELLGMFAFTLWDHDSHTLHAVRDRFGVKPLYWYFDGERLAVASEIKALLALGIPADFDETTWADYLQSAVYDHDERTFWRGIQRLLPGSLLRFTPGQSPIVTRWYDFEQQVAARGPIQEESRDALWSLLNESVALRLHPGLPCAITLSGGFDSSLIAWLMQRQKRASTPHESFTFICGDARYDETPHAFENFKQHIVPINPGDIPALALQMQHIQDAPYGGIPTLGMGEIYRMAQGCGVKLLLDGNGLDEAFLGYAHYFKKEPQGAGQPPLHHSFLKREFADLAQTKSESLYTHHLRQMQIADITQRKLPRALRFIDHASMAFSIEVREPFLDHRLMELGVSLEVPITREKRLLRTIASEEGLPQNLALTRKRSVQTPQSEWLLGPLQDWSRERIEDALQSHWFNADAVRGAFKNAMTHGVQNSFQIWQWISISLMREAALTHRQHA